MVSPVQRKVHGAVGHRHPRGEKSRYRPSSIGLESQPPEDRVSRPVLSTVVITTTEVTRNVTQFLTHREITPAILEAGIAFATISRKKVFSYMAAAQRKESQNETVGQQVLTGRLLRILQAHDHVD